MHSCEPFFPPLSAQRMGTVQNNCCLARIWHIFEAMMPTYRNCWMTSSRTPSPQLLAGLHYPAGPCSLSGPALATAMCNDPRCTVTAGATPEKSRVAPPAMTGPICEWLRKKSGAIRRNHMWSSRRARKLANTTLRCDVEQQETCSLAWRACEDHPICTATNLRASLPYHKPGGSCACIDYSQPSAGMEAGPATMLCRFQSAHVGFILDYLHEARFEPCARSVPSAILKSLALMEQADGVPDTERFSAQAVVRNTVNQLTMELE